MYIVYTYTYTNYDTHTHTHTHTFHQGLLVPLPDAPMLAVENLLSHIVRADSKNE